MTGNKNWLIAVTGGLLSSSCCVIQLGLNYFSVGCAGFAILDPYRPIFLALSLTLLVSSLLYNLNCTGTIQRQTIFAIFFALFLYSTPHLLKLANESGFAITSNSIPQHFDMKTDLPKIELHFAVESVKCDACAHRVRDSVMSVAGVVSVSLTINEDSDAHMTVSIATSDREAAAKAIGNVLDELVFGACCNCPSKIDACTRDCDIDGAAIDLPSCVDDCKTAGKAPLCKDDCYTYPANAVATLQSLISAASYTATAFVTDGHDLVCRDNDYFNIGGLNCVSDCSGANIAKCTTDCCGTSSMAMCMEDCIYTDKKVKGSLPMCFKDCTSNAAMDMCVKDCDTKGANIDLPKCVKDCKTAGSATLCKDDCVKYPATATDATEIQYKRMGL